MFSIVSFPIIKKYKIKPTKTAITATNDSKNAMITGLAPTFLKYLNFNSFPIVKAMNPKATTETISKPGRASSLMMLSIEGPIKRPPIR